MRPLLPGDLDCAARALLAVAPPGRARAAAALVTAADTADRFRKRLGRAHPALGDGSLMTAALPSGPLTMSRWCDDAYCGCLAAVLAALARRRTEGQARAHCKG